MIYVEWLNLFLFQTKTACCHDLYKHDNFMELIPCLLGQLPAVNLYTLSTSMEPIPPPLGPTAGCHYLYKFDNAMEHIPLWGQLQAAISFAN